MAFVNCKSLGALVSLAFAVSVNAQSVETNGYWWLAQPEQVKIAYVMGAMDHATFANPDILRNKLRGVRAACAALDEFYATPSNRSVFVAQALPAAWLIKKAE